MNTCLVFVWALLVCRTAASSCYKCSWSKYRLDDRVANPKVSALFDSMMSDNDQNCMQNKQIAPVDCGAGIPCAMLRFQVEVRLVNTDGTTETGRFKDRYVRRCSPVTTAQVPKGCNDIAPLKPLVEAALRAELNLALGYTYDGEVYADNLMGFFCHYAGSDNSNGASLMGPPWSWTCGAGWGQTDELFASYD